MNQYVTNSNCPEFHTGRYPKIFCEKNPDFIALLLFYLYLKHNIVASESNSYNPKRSHDATKSPHL